MKNSAHRDLILDISEIEPTTNVFTIIKKMMFALKNNEITSNQYELLLGTLVMQCRRNKINIDL
jgi:hypothetical protein